MTCAARREGRIGRRLVAERPFVNGVVGRHVVHLGALACVALAQSTTARQLAIADIDEFRRRLGLLLGLGDDHRHVIADIAHLALRQDRMRAGLHGRAVLGMDHPAADQPADLVLGDILAGEHRDDAGCLSAFDGLIDLIVAWACGRRTK